MGGKCCKDRKLGKIAPDTDGELGKMGKDHLKDKVKEGPSKDKKQKKEVVGVKPPPVDDTHMKTVDKFPDLAGDLDGHYKKYAKEKKFEKFDDSLYNKNIPEYGPCQL